MILTRKKLTEVIQNVKNGYLIPGIKAEVKAEVDRVLSNEILQEIYQQLGYRPSVSFFSLDGRRNFPPGFSVAEKVDALAEHLGLVFDKTAAQPAKVILRKPQKKDRPVVYRKKSLKLKAKAEGDT